ncbi:MAG: hypothetical protein HY962_14950 [Ignavibacteriae bacterium]|nr:hypothetical protein [Ignavibacteriota bacterium]
MLAFMNGFMSDPAVAAAVLSAVAAAVSLLIGVWTYRRQINVQAFFEYTRRFEDIINQLSVEERSTLFDANPPPETISPEANRFILRYLNLCSEEYYLVKKGWLSKDVWNIWKQELERTIKSPVVDREWKTYRDEFSAYTEFRSYVDQLLRK